MVTRRINYAVTDYRALQEELEYRHCSAAAQAIVGEVRRVEQSGDVPGYMVVKALSECVEELAPEAGDRETAAYRESRDLFHRFYRRAMAACVPANTVRTDRPDIKSAKSIKKTVLAA